MARVRIAVRVYCNEVGNGIVTEMSDAPIAKQLTWGMKQIVKIMLGFRTQRSFVNYGCRGVRGRSSMTSSAVNITFKTHFIYGNQYSRYV